MLGLFGDGPGVPAPGVQSESRSGAWQTVGDNHFWRMRNGEAQAMSLEIIGMSAGLTGPFINIY